MKSHFCSVSAIAVVAVCMATPAFAQIKTFDVPSQEAVTGVPAFGIQAGLQIVASASGLEGKRTGAVKGPMSVDQGLQQLLRGTGLRIGTRQGSTVTLVADRPAPRAENTARVAAKSDDAPPVNPESDSVQEIIVSGVRYRLSEAPQVVKKNNIAFVATVGAVEIAKRTDVSIADAMLRLPGIVKSRGFMTASSWYPAIRGFDGKYSSVTLDGGTLYNSTRNQRGVYLDLIPAAAINQITVYKTVVPEMDPNSIGGHIDVKTVRSFDLGGDPITRLDVQGTYYAQDGTPKGHNPSGMVNGVIKRTFGADGNFGFVLAGSAHSDRFNEQFNNTIGYVQTNGVNIPSGNLATGNFDRQTRGESGLGKLEGRGDNWYGFVAGSYFHEHIEADLYRSNVSIVPTLVTATADGSGTFTGATPQAFSSLSYLDRRISSLTAGGEYKTNDTSKIVVNASVLQARYNEQFWTGGNITGPAVSGSYNLSDTSVRTTLNPVTGLSDANAWTQKGGTTSNQTFFPMRDNIYTARLEYKSNNFDFSRGLGFDVGVDWRRLHRVLDQRAYTYTLPAASSIRLSDVLIPGTSFDGANTGQAVYIDRTKYWNAIASQGTLTVDNALTTDYNLTEDVLAPFLALYYTTDKFRLIAGARYNITHFNDTTGRITNGTFAPFHIKRTIPYFLPNIQGYYDIREGVRIRAALTETTALIDFNNFAQGQATNFNFAGVQVTTGSNPYLKPKRSTNADLSLEFYRSQGFLTIGYFHKKIINEVFNVTQSIRDANGVLIQTLQSPVNGGGERSQGVEIEGQWRDFTGVAPWLSGLTVDANLAVFDSRTNAILSDGSTRRIDALTLQPKYVANLIFSYEKGPFQATIMGMKRGKAFNGFSLNKNADLYIAPYSSLDMKASYKVLDSVKLYVEGRNLTKSWWREQTGSNKEQIASAIQAGRSFVVGASMSF